MGILERLRHAIRANVHELAAHSDNPERQLDALLERLTRDLDDARIEIASAARDERRLRAELMDTRYRAQVMAEKAKLALERDDEELAREAIRRKVVAESRAVALSDQLELECEGLQTLRDHLAALEARLEEAQRYRDVVATRNRLSAAQRGVTGDTSGRNTTEALERIQDSVISLEAETQAVHEELESRLSLIEQKVREGAEEQRIDDELRRLRQVIGQAVRQGLAPSTGARPHDEANGLADRPEGV